jgi:hypothetical protein
MSNNVVSNNIVSNNIVLNDRLNDLVNTWVMHSLVRVAQWLQGLRQIHGPLLSAIAWMIVALILGSIITAVRDTLGQSRVMHNIPCANCDYFTDDHRLKCTLHPSAAGTEAAIDCRDFDERLS